MHDDLKMIGTGKKLILDHGAEQDDGAQHRPGGGKDHLPAMMQAPDQNPAEAAIERRVVDIVRVIANRGAQFFNVEYLVADEGREQHRDNPRQQHRDHDHRKQVKRVLGGR